MNNDLSSLIFKEITVSSGHTAVPWEFWREYLPFTFVYIQSYNLTLKITLIFYFSGWEQSLIKPSNDTRTIHVISRL